MYRSIKIIPALVIVLALSMMTGAFVLAQQGGVNQALTAQPEFNSPEAPQYDPVPGGPGFLMIPAAAFTAGSSGMLYSIDAQIVTQTGSPSSYYIAPVNLPQETSVAKLVFYFYDNDMAKSTYITLERFDLGNLATNIMAAVQSPLSPAVGNSFSESTTITDGLIDNQAYSYYIKLVLPPPTQGSVLIANAVRIDYSYPSYLPAVQR